MKKARSHAMNFVLSLALFALLLPGGATADPILPVIPAGTFLITAYGAVGDGTTDNTAAVTAAITAAENAGGGTVEVPAAAHNYLCGPISLGSNLRLQIDAGATLQALPYGGVTNNPGTYPINGTTYPMWIGIYGQSNVEIDGPGTLDGQGAAWWAAFDKNGSMPHRPYMVLFSNCSFVAVRNLTLTNSPMEHIAFSSPTTYWDALPSNNVTIDGVTITTSGSSPNTDGVDPAGSHILIQNCTINDGDDDIGIKPSNGFCSDITVRNCTIGTGHGISIGGQTNSGLDGLTVTDCTFNGTVNGLRMKADPTQGGLAQNITYANITMTNVAYPIVFYSYYHDIGTPNGSTTGKVQSYNTSPPDGFSSTMPVWNNITLSNVTSTGATHPSIIWGLPAAGYFISNVTFNNVSIAGTQGFEFYNAQNVQFTGTTSIGGTLTTYNAQVITSQPQSQTVGIGGNAALTVAVAPASATNGTLTPACQWNFNGAALTDGTLPDGCVVSGSASASLSLGNVQAAEAGAYTCTVTHHLDNNANLTSGGLAANAYSATVTSAAAVLTVDPAVVSQPASITAGAGQTAVFSVTASGNTALSYQWNFNTAPISGATDAYLVLSNVQSAAAGSYTCTVTDSAGSVTSNPAALTFSSSTDFGRIINCSIRDNAGTGDSQLIAGFVLGGAGTDGSAKTVLLRGDGPTLAGYGVTGALADPALNVFQPSVSTTAPLYTNTGWNNDATVASVSAQVGAFALTAGSLDSALVESLTPGSYTANITGGTGDTGIALAEVYDATTSFTATTPRLVNVSGRAQISNGNGSLIAGFVIGGSTEKTVLVRGLGPVLANYGVPGALADPQLAVHQLNPDGSDGGVIAVNTAWAGDPALSAIFTSVDASPLADPASADCALLVSLPPGVYTANVTSASNATGVALVEVYEVP